MLLKNLLVWLCAWPLALLLSAVFLINLYRFIRKYTDAHKNCQFFDVLVVVLG